MSLARILDEAAAKIATINDPQLEPELIATRALMRAARKGDKQAAIIALKAAMNLLRAAVNESDLEHAVDGREVLQQVIQ